MSYLLRCRSEQHKWLYYQAVNGATGRAVTGPKCTAPTFDRPLAKKVASQLVAIDNRGWEIVKKAEGA